MNRKKSCCGGCAKGTGCEGTQKAGPPLSLEESAYLVDLAATPANGGGYNEMAQEAAQEADPRSRIGGGLADYIAIAAAANEIPEKEVPPATPSKGNFEEGGLLGVEGISDSPNAIENLIESVFSNRKCQMVSPAQVVQAEPVISQAERLFTEGRFF